MFLLTLLSCVVGIRYPWLLWPGFGCMQHYDLPSPLPFMEECDCEEVLLSASNLAFSIFSISTSDSICAERLLLLVRILFLSGSSWFRMGVISACTIR